jgi:hypothetical protein
MKLNESQNKNLSIPNPYMNMTLEKIEKEIENLNELMDHYEKEKNFLEAESVKQDLILAQKAKEQVKIKDTKYRHIQEIEAIQSDENDEIIELNNKMKEKWEKLNEKFKKMELKLNKVQEDEMEKFQKVYEDKLKLTMKPSNQLIAAEKKKNFYLKKKE